MYVAGPMAIGLAALLGLLVGSVLNVVIARVPAGESIFSPRSRCPACQTEIAAYDGIPVLSWLLLRGRCRHCQTQISIRYPAVELLTAAAFAAVVAVRGFNADLVLELPLVAALIALAAIDLDHRILPNVIVYPLALYGLAATAVVDGGDLVEHVVTGAGAFTLLLVAALVYPSGMGMGDVKLTGAMGLFLGLEIIPALFVAFLAGTVVGLVIIAREGAGARKQAVPFGVFLALGGAVAVLAGGDLIDSYRDSFLS